VKVILSGQKNEWKYRDIVRLNSSNMYKLYSVDSEINFRVMPTVSYWYNNSVMNIIATLHLNKASKWLSRHNWQSVHYISDEMLSFVSESRFAIPLPQVYHPLFVWDNVFHVADVYDLLNCQNWRLMLSIKWKRCCNLCFCVWFVDLNLTRAGYSQGFL